MIRLAQAVLTSLVVGSRIINREEVIETQRKEDERRESLSEYDRWKEDNQRFNKNLMR